MEAFVNWFEVRDLNVYLLLGLVILFLGTVVRLFFYLTPMRTNRRMKMSSYFSGLFLISR